MKTKFCQVVKIRQEQLDRAGSELLKARGKEDAAKSELADITLQIAELKFPSSGAASLITQTLAQSRIMQAQKLATTEKLRLASLEVAHHQNRYKMAHIELEKMKFLQSEQIKAMLAKIHRTETAQLDDIAVMRHSFLKAGR